MKALTSKSSSKAVSTYHGSKAVAKGASAASLSMDGRAFHVNDYRHAARLLAGMRKDQHGHMKNAQQQERVNALAMAMAAVFEADSHEFGVPFSAGYFVAGTQ